MAKTEPRPAMAAYSAYYHTEGPEDEHELTQVGRGTPCGEYLRRFWHPVGLSAELKDLPKAIRILGEDLVLFRDARGRVGLLELHCSHRGTSLEYGTIEGRGVRCCYHGWLYAVDGQVLETPGEPAGGAYKDRLYHGAYPTLEYKGLVFAYMGPPDKRPAFPIYDTYDLPGYRVVAQGRPDTSDAEPCNWLQLAENNMDPVHTVFLHGLEGRRSDLGEYRPGVDPNGSLERYVDAGVKEWETHVAALRDEFRHHVVEYHEAPGGMFYIHTRRIGEGDLVWVRIADYILPNIDQIPRTLPVEELTEQLPFDAPRTTTWTVPVDDTHTTSFALLYAPEKLNGIRPSRWRLTSPDASTTRTYEDRQREPGDYEAQVSQGPIAVHGREHLAWSDGGVITVRRLLRDGVRAVQQGADPAQVDLARKGVIDTYGQSTILRVPRAAGLEADQALLRETGRKVAAARHAGAPGSVAG